jgi:hypothetical protein
MYSIEIPKSYPLTHHDYAQEVWVVMHCEDGVMGVFVSAERAIAYLNDWEQTITVTKNAFDAPGRVIDVFIGDKVTYKIEKTDYRL